MKNYKILIKNKEVFGRKDGIFQSYLINKFINELIRKGNKKKVENIFYKSLSLIKIKNKNYNSYILLFEAVELLRPYVTVVNKRIKQNKIDIPVFIKKNLQYRIAIRWIISSVKGYKNTDYFFDNYIKEILGIVVLGKSISLSKREDLYNKVIEARANRYYSWRV